MKADTTPTVRVIKAAETRGAIRQPTPIVSINAQTGAHAVR